jgi:nucleoside-diphosphate-sugar epimerase
MRVFLTGGTGFVGGGIARALLARGHDVAGLARSGDAEERLRAAGVEPVSGDLADAEALRRGAAGADAVVQAAFPRDAYERLDEAIALDRRAVDALVHAVAGSSTRLCYTSGISVVGDAEGTVVDEDTPLRTPPRMQWRRDLELAVLDAGGIVLRPVFVHGRGEGDILRSLLRRAGERRESLYPAPGDKPWSTVHVDDLGTAFALALEGAPPATVLNVAAGETTVRKVAEAIGRLIGHPERTRALPPAEAAGVIPYAGWLGGGPRVSARRARTLLHWRPAGPDLLDDLEHGSYRRLVAPTET